MAKKVFKIVANAEIHADNINEVFIKLGAYYTALYMGEGPKSPYTGGFIKINWIEEYTDEEKNNA